MMAQLDDVTEQDRLASEGRTTLLTTTPVVGTPAGVDAATFARGAEELGIDEVRVPVLGAGTRGAGPPMAQVPEPAACWADVPLSP
jgi:hypothetical protein